MTLASGRDPESTDVLPAGDSRPLRWRLVVLKGAPAELVLEAGTYRIGTGLDCDLVLDDRAVSRAHLELAVLSAGVRFRDLGSTNGSFCEGLRFQEIEGGPGTVVRLGKTELVLLPEGGAAATLPPSTRESFGRLRGRSLAMRRAYALLERVAPSDAGVLIRGETGTGKELCADAIHAHSARAKQPFVIVDLAGVPSQLLESELFGHVRGAFTGALSERAGAFERAHRGTLFLDEIGELPLELQPRLLRALESRQVKRIGANDWRRFDVRILAATNRDLAAECRAGRFREDLYHRLAIVEISLPPLRERREDIPMIVDALLSSMGRDTRLGPETLGLLAAWDWPGNVRELRNVIERAVSLGGGAEEVPPELLALPATPSAPLPIPPTPSSGVPFKEAKEQLVTAFERDYLAALLEEHGRNVSKAARAAGIDRVYLHRLMRKHGLA